MISLVGYTGFVGSNLLQKGQFDAIFNSKNIQDSYGTNPDLLIYAGLRAEKYLANQDPEKDFERIHQAEHNIERINPKKLVLISTIDVFQRPVNVDENSVVETEGLQAYGYNRYCLECWVRENYPTALIIRLPGLFGRNIRKNFIYDFINIIPSVLTKSKFKELIEKEPQIKNYYQSFTNDYYKAVFVENEREKLKNIFLGIGFSALNFTDSRSVYQFYNLERLWGDIQTALKNDLRLWHPATEPLSAGELYEYLTHHTFINELSSVPQYYNYRTLYAELFGGSSFYIENKSQVLYEISNFVEKMSCS